MSHAFLKIIDFAKSLYKDKSEWIFCIVVTQIESKKHSKLLAHHYVTIEQYLLKLLHLVHVGIRHSDNNVTKQSGTSADCGCVCLSVHHCLKTSTKNIHCQELKEGYRIFFIL